MISIFNRIKVQSLLALMSVVFLLACDNESDQTDGVTDLSYVESTIPGELSAEGGTVSLEVAWAYTQWNVKVGEVIEGAAFITEVRPSYAGAEDTGSTQTKVNLTFVANTTYSYNSQELILRSLTGDLADTIIISQSAKAVEPVNITIDPATTYQTISGFGGAAIWNSLPLSDSHLQTLLGTGENELGLSIVRVRLSPVSSQWSSDVSMLQKIETYGAKIMASPWSPPGEWKYDTQEDPLINGYLMEEHYADYANYLNDYVQFMADENIIIDVVSIQNEPDWTASYESCEWTPEMMYNFVKNHASVIDAKVLAAESLRFAENYTDDILNDPLAAANLDIVGGHLYGARQPSHYTLAEEKEKEIWMTEYLLNSGYGDDAIQPGDWINVSETEIWDESMEMLESIHESMISNWNAYIWWYIKRYYSFMGDGNGGTAEGETLKRGLAFSQFSKFVRPGYVRVDAQPDNGSTPLKITTYKAENKIVAVIINPENNPIYEVTLSITETISSVEAFTTSEFDDRVKEALSPDGNKVTLDMKAKSITTVILNY